MRMTPIKLAHWFNQKQTEMGNEAKDQTQGLAHWIAAACMRATGTDQSVGMDESGGSLMARRWKSYNHAKDEAFAWASKRLDAMLKPWIKQPNVEKMGNFNGAMNKLVQAMQQ